MDLFWTVFIIVVVLGVIGWFWIHNKSATTNVFEKTGKAVDDAVNKAEEFINKPYTTANTANTTTANTP